MMLMLVCVMAAATVGFAAHQGGTCGVVAVEAWIDRRDARLLVGFAVACGTASLVCLPLAWAIGRGDALAGSTAIGLPLVAGAALLGVGAVVNGACFVGSLWRLGNGEAHLIGLPIGIVTGDLVGQMLGWHAAVSRNPHAQPDAGGVAVVVAGGLVLWLARRWLRQRGAARLALTMAAMGAAGGLLFVALPGWSWAEVLNHEAHTLFGMEMMVNGAAVRATLATLAGALASGWLTGQLHLKWRGWPALARSIGGGVLMMLGARLIPGGNDALLLGAIPAGAWSALLAFAVMNLAIWALRSAARLRPAAPPALR